ncbi:MAG: type II toxin-antitoxin system VapC family toxin [bacterium]
MTRAVQPILLDTDVVIDYLRGSTQAAEFLEHAGAPLLLSAMTVAELYAGVRDGEEVRTLERFCRAFQIVDVNAAIAGRGGMLRRDYGKSHGVGLADAIIAACAESKKATLVTLNRRHFPMLQGVITPYSK